MKRIFSMALAAALLIAALSACAPKSGGEHDDQGKQVDLADFAQTVQEIHEFSGFLQRIDPEDADMGELMAQMLDMNYAGLSELDLGQLELYMSMISFSSNELALAQAKNADDAAKVKEIFQARIDDKTTEGQNNYPEEVELWQHNSALVSNGNYVMLVCADDCDAIVEEFNTLFQ